MLSTYTLAILLYGLATLIIDIVNLSRDTLHRMSSRYAPYMRRADNSSPKRSSQCASRCNRLKENLVAFYFKYLVADTTGWIVLKFFGEILEFAVQSQAWYVYNGSSMFDDEVHLANKPDIIIVFAFILAFNCFGSGILWMIYALMSKSCYGLIFKRAIFFSDKFSDLLYTLFPFYVVFADDYNANTDEILVMLGQLNAGSTSAFLAAFTPLFLLCNKTLLIMISTTNTHRDVSFSEWKALRELSLTPCTPMATMKAQDAGIYCRPPTEMYDADGKLTISMTTATKSYDKSWIDKNDYNHPECIRILKQSMLSTIALAFIGFGIFVAASSVAWVQSSEAHCNSVMESTWFDSNGTALFDENETIPDSVWQTFADNPELFVWDQCQYKVYPFVTDDVYRCQCRVFIINWDELRSSAEDRAEKFNLTQPEIMSGALNHWYMLEKLKTEGVGGDATQSIQLTASINSPFLRVFEWRDATIDSNGTTISSWHLLEFLLISGTPLMGRLPVSLRDSNQIKYLSLAHNGLLELSPAICNLHQLDVLNIENEYLLSSLPSCLGELTQLRVLWLDFLTVSAVPFTLFSLPNLIELSMYNGNLNYNSMLTYNFPSFANDTQAIGAWFDQIFAPRYDDANYWLSLNPICDNFQNDMYPSALVSFLNVSCTDNLCAVDGGRILGDFCAPRLLGDGRCDYKCEIFSQCGYDYGDCSQLCFAPELTNCTMEKFTNARCDHGCNNNYCSLYGISSDFESPTRLIRGDEYWQADSMNCLALNTTVSLGNVTFDAEACAASESAFLVPGIAEYIRTAGVSCQLNYFSNGYCDDLCRTEECLYDGGECDDMICEEGCKEFTDFWGLMKFFTNTNEDDKISHETICSNEYLLERTRVGLGRSSFTEDECLELLQKWDWNDDDFLNFREFQPVGAEMTDAPIAYWLQANCSQCVGIEAYTA